MIVEPLLDFCPRSQKALACIDLVSIAAIWYPTIKLQYIAGQSRCRVIVLLPFSTSFSQAHPHRNQQALTLFSTPVIALHTPPTSIVLANTVPGNGVTRRRTNLVLAIRIGISIAIGPIGSVANGSDAVERVDVAIARTRGFVARRLIANAAAGTGVDLP